jgi:hypothetical protein
MVSRHSANAATAAINHQIWFGEDGVRWRATPTCAWQEIPNAVVHGEITRYVTRGNPAVRSKAIQRTVFVEGLQVPTLAQIQVGGCKHTYTVVETHAKGTRLGLTCQRENVAEITRPDYRNRPGGQ